MSSPNNLDFYDAELRAHHEHLRAAYGISPGDEVSTSAADPGCPSDRKRFPSPVVRFRSP